MLPGICFSESISFWIIKIWKYQILIDDFPSQGPKVGKQWCWKKSLCRVSKSTALLLQREMEHGAA